MKTYRDYINDACQQLDNWAGEENFATPTQLQTINLALLMAVSDLIKVLESK